ncbi:MAG: nicotinate-nucleotide adenylyltransferase [Prevotella sp.]|nr:nicotinate-nucleotide adenylyltransferase [Prevotella sp.]MBR1840399.1 nicotinate-nucleotide adenylyltransferase [Prevotella sp.]
MRIGIFGGSFNPIHNGHIALGTSMLSAMSLYEVWYLVSPQNPLKRTSAELIDETLRLRLVEAALDDHPHLVASDYEFHLQRPSYTWNTLNHLRKDYPQHQFVLIIGGDNLANFLRWAHHDDIIADYEIAVYPRSNSDIPEWVKSHDNIKVIDVPLVDISSTQLRQMIRSGEDVSPYMPPKVVSEVEKLSLYR